MAAQEGTSTECVESTASRSGTKMSASDFRIYNNMAEHMDYFHDHFRSMWKVLYAACEAGKRPEGMSIGQFLGLAERLCGSLDMHHKIEEVHIFPVLATRMPVFSKELELLEQHRQIHEGLDVFHEWVEQCRGGGTDFSLKEMKILMDNFGTVLWQHLDDEVKQLGAENMRKYWSKQEMQSMPM